MLLTDFVQLSIKDRANELIANYDMDSSCISDLLFAGKGFKRKAQQVRVVDWSNLTEEQQEQVDATEDGCGDYFVVDGVVYDIGEFMVSNSDDFVAAYGISNTFAMVIYSMTNEDAIVGVVW